MTVKQQIDQAVEQICSIVIDKEQEVRLAVCCALAGGHLLLEDLPGTGKTTFASAIAKTFDLTNSRVQFTNDLLPSDITGVSVFQPHNGEFAFKPGPVFTQLFLADEINRASPKSQSALLEAMEEHQVSIEGETRNLPQPFLVVATQNPFEQTGVYPLPEAQLDRFLMRLSLGYAAKEAELKILAGEDVRSALQALSPLMTSDDLISAQTAVRSVTASDDLLDYIYELVNGTRTHSGFSTGLSTRAAQGVLSAAKAWAIMQGRDYAVPADVQTVFSPVAVHRLSSNRSDTNVVSENIQQILDAVAV
ncbi:MAG: MoxR family ATPase [Pseudomonadota bacterium]